MQGPALGYHIVIPSICFPSSSTSQLSKQLPRLLLHSVYLSTGGRALVDTSELQKKNLKGVRGFYRICPGSPIGNTYGQKVAGRELSEPS